MLPPRADVRLGSKKDLPFILLFLIIFLWMFKEFFFTSGVFFERDSTLLELPTRKICAELLREGNFALWTDAHGNGQPFLANPKNAVFYPTTWLYLFLPLFTAFKLHYLIHVLLGWLGLYYLCKSYSLSRKASFLGASLFTLSGIYLSSFEFYNHIASLAWMPWILLVLGRDPNYGRGDNWPPSPSSGPFSSCRATPDVILLTIVFSLRQSAFAREGARRKIVLALLRPWHLGAHLRRPAPPVLRARSAGRPRNRQSRGMAAGAGPAREPRPSRLPRERPDARAREFWGWHLFDRQSPFTTAFTWASERSSCSSSG